MAFDPVQILRQTYAGGAAAAGLEELARQPAAAERAPVSRGELMGTTFAVESNPAADLMDSMEELTAQFEEKEVKRMAERRMGPLQGPRAAFVRALEAWSALMGDMPGLSTLERLAKALREAKLAGFLPSAGDLLKSLARESTDPSHQFAMLDMLERAMGDADSDIKELLRGARAQLMAERGADVKAGINLAAEVNERATTPQQMQELRDLYRSEVGGFSKPQECFRSLLASRGPEGLKDALSFLLAGCGRDLASASPSMDREALARIMTDLQCVQVLETMIDKFSQLVERMQRQFGERCLLDGVQLTGQTVDLTEQAFVTSAAVSTLLAECGISKLLAKMDFTRELTRLFRLLSPRLFAKDGDRQRLVDAAQDHLDFLVGFENGGGDAGEEGAA